jgi:hypothetical protein
LLNEYGVLQYEQSWPLLLVIWGASIVAGSFREPRLEPMAQPVDAGGLGAATDRRGRRRDRSSRDASLLWLVIIVATAMSLQAGRFGRTTRTDSDRVVRRYALLGESRSISYATDFRQGDLTAVMGRCELDLTHASTASAREPVVHVHVVMGEATLRMPRDWSVDVRAVPVIGDVHDYRGQPGADAPADSSRPRVLVRGFVMFGALEIRD